MANKQRLIDANKAKAVLVNMAEHLQEAGNPEMAGAVGYAAEVIGKQPTVDAAPVVHGCWTREHKVNRRMPMCSACGNLQTSTSNYCSHCGAKMDGGNDNA